MILQPASPHGETENHGEEAFSSCVLFYRAENASEHIMAGSFTKSYSPYSLETPSFLPSLERSRWPKSSSGTSRHSQRLPCSLLSPRHQRNSTSSWNWEDEEDEAPGHGPFVDLSPGQSQIMDKELQPLWSDVIDSQQKEWEVKKLAYIFAFFPEVTEQLLLHNNPEHVEHLGRWGNFLNKEKCSSLPENLTTDFLWHV